jgi:hypothetical protein
MKATYLSNSLGIMTNSNKKESHTPIPDNWPVPNCIRTGPRGGKDVYFAYSCSGEGVERKELWIHDGEPVPDEVIERMEHEAPESMGIPISKLDGERITIKKKHYTRKEIKYDGTEVWEIHEGGMGVHGWTKTVEVKDNEVIERKGKSYSFP